MTTNETYDLDAEILLAANPYRIPSDADLVEAERGCNQYKHKPGCPEADGSEEKNSRDSWAERWQAKSDEEKLGAYEAGLKRAEEEAKKTGSFDAFERVKIHRKRVASYRKKIARSVLKKNDSLFNDIKTIHEKNGTDFLRKSGVNIMDAINAYSKARGAALFVESEPSSERYAEARSDMKKGSEELLSVYEKLNPGHDTAKSAHEPFLE